MIEIRPPTGVEVTRTPERNADGTLTEAWWASLPLNTVVKVSGTVPATTLQPQLDAITNETGEKWRDHGGEKLYGVWGDWCGASLDPRGKMHVNGGGHAGSSNGSIHTWDIERMTWNVTVPTCVITAAMIAQMMDAAYGPTGKNPNPSATFGGNVGIGWDGYSGSFYRDALGVEYPVGYHTYNLMPWDSKRNRIFSQRYGAFIAWIPDEGRWFKLGPQVAAQAFGKMIYDPVGDRVYQFADSDEIGRYFGFAVIDAETGTYLEKRVRFTPTLPPKYNFLHLDGVVLIGREIWFFAPAFQVAFALNIDTRVARVAPGIVFPADIKSPGAVVHLGGSQVLMLAQRTQDGVRKDALLLIDVAAETCVPYAHDGVLPLSLANGNYGRFALYERRRTVVLSTRHDTEVRLMRVG